MQGVLATDRLQRLIESRGIREDEDTDEPDKPYLLKAAKFHKQETARAFSRLERHVEDEDWSGVAGDLFKLLGSMSSLLIHFGMGEDVALLDKLKQRVINHGRKYR